MILKHETEGIYKGRLVIADNSYLDELESPDTPDEHKKRLKKLIYDKTFRTKFQCKIQGFITENGFENVVVLHFIKNGVEPQMSFNPVDETMSVPKGSRQQKLGCDTASYAIYSEEEYAHINTLADGFMVSPLQMQMKHCFYYLWVRMPWNLLNSMKMLNLH